MKTSILAISALAVLLAAGAAWHWHALANAAEPAAEQNDEASVLVRLAPAVRQAQARTVGAFGEIATGKPEALSFPQPGQLLQLPVVAGQRVRRGDPVAVIGTDPASVAAYAQAANAVGFAQRELKRQQELAQLQLATQSQVDAALPLRGHRRIPFQSFPFDRVRSCEGCYPRRPWADGPVRVLQFDASIVCFRAERSTKSAWRRHTTPDPAVVRSRYCVPRSIVSKVTNGSTGSRTGCTVSRAGSTPERAATCSAVHGSVTRSIRC